MARMVKNLLLIFLFVLTIYSRFLNLNWDSGWGFHPDENNLWGASRSIKWFSNLDPKFYAYGGFPIYLYSFLDSKVQARTVSAVLQTGIIGLLYLTGRKLRGERAGFLAALMGISSAGLIQAGHFLTVESLLGFFGLLILYSLISYHELENNHAGRHTFLRISFWLILASISLGLGVGTKISFVVFALPLAAFILRPGLFKKAGPLLALLIAVFIFLLTNPFLLTKWQFVLETLKYESNVATGNLPVFYTRQFLGTVPGWFQAVHVFPFITGWLFVPVFFVGVFVVSIKVRPWKIPRSDLLMLLTAISALLSFLPMWAKWTRYVVQALPILILISALGADWIWEKGRIGKSIVLLIIISFLPQFFSIMKVYGSLDSRLVAADWAEVNIPKNAKIFTEGMDLGILPFNPIHGQNITLFNFYELDSPSEALVKEDELNTLVNESDYFISVSNRVYGNSLRLPDKFLASADFYKRLLDGSLGFQKVYDSPFVVIPAKAGIYLNRFRVKHGMTEGLSPEETFEVFDHPSVMIFKKNIKTLEH